MKKKLIKVNTEINEMKTNIVERTNIFKSWFFHKIYNHLMSMTEERREENIRIEGREKHTQKD